MRRPVQVGLICALLAILAIFVGMIGYHFAQRAVESRGLPGNRAPSEMGSMLDS